MGIRISERTDIFQIPYESPNSEGTPDASFVDVKANPAWIAVIPSCLGWPETQQLLQSINSPTSELMSLAADQGFSTTEHPKLKVALTSFVTLCLAKVACNNKPAIVQLAEFLQTRMEELLQATSTALQQSLYIDVVIEAQPTIFHNRGVEGWSLTVLMATSGVDPGEARNTWQFGMQALEDSLSKWRC